MAVNRISTLREVRAAIAGNRTLSIEFDSVVARGGPIDAGLASAITAELARVALSSDQVEMPAAGVSPVRLIREWVDLLQGR